MYRHFDFVTVAKEAKAKKPSPEIFEYAIKQGNFNKEKWLHIGDKPEKDYYPVQEMGYFFFSFFFYVF